MLLRPSPLLLQVLVVSLLDVVEGASRVLVSQSASTIAP